MVNLFKGFRLFAEEGQPPLPQPQQSQQQKAPGFRSSLGTNYANTIKKQIRVPKKLWFGMPLSIGANKTINLDGRLFKGPMTFFVTEFDDKTVTMKLVRNPMDFSFMDDPDDEIDPDNMDDGGEQQFTIPRSTFEKLLEPDNYPGADFATASQTALAPR